MDDSEAKEVPQLSWPEALKKGNLEAVESLLKEDATLVEVETDNMLPVMLAMRAKNPQLIRLLLAHGARPSGLPAFQEAQRANALFLAAQTGDAESCDVLLEVGKLNPDGVAHFIPVIAAAHHHHLGVLKVLDKHGANLNIVSAGDGSNAIIETSRWTSSPAVIDFLVSKGVACDLEDSRGMTPLMYLANLGDVESIKILVERGGAKLDHRMKRQPNHARNDLQANQSDDALSLAEKKKMSEVVFYCWTQGLNPSNVSMRCHLGDINVTKPRLSADIGARNHFAMAASGSKVFVFGGVAFPYDKDIATIQSEPTSTDDAALPRAFKVSLKEFLDSTPSEPHVTSAEPVDDAEDDVDPEDAPEEGLMGEDRMQDALQLRELLGDNPGQAEFDLLMARAREDPDIGELLNRIMGAAQANELDDDSDDDSDNDMDEDEDFGVQPKLEAETFAKIGDVISPEDEAEEVEIEILDAASNASDSDSSDDEHSDYVPDRYNYSDRSQQSYDCFCLDLDETTMEPIFPLYQMGAKLKDNKLDLKRHGKFLKLDEDGLGGRAVTPLDNESFVPCLALGVKSFNASRASLAYFEMQVLATGTRRLISIGLVGKHTPIEGRQPGWDAGTFGLHGDDGSLFCEEGSGNQFSDRFEAGDVIGVGVHWDTQRVFFTVNGRFLGFAPVKVRLSRLYSCVAVRNPDAAFRVNFGTEPFRFDFRAPVLHWKRILPPSWNKNTLDPRQRDSWHESADMTATDEKSQTKRHQNSPMISRPIFATEPNNQYLVLLTVDARPTSANMVYLFNLEKKSFITHTFLSSEPSIPIRLMHNQTQHCQISPRTMLFYRPRAKTHAPTIAFFDTVLLRWFDISQSQPASADSSDSLSASTGIRQSQNTDLRSSSACMDIDDRFPQEIPEYHAMWLEVLTSLDQSNAEGAKLHMAGSNVVWSLSDSYLLADPVTGMHSIQPYNKHCSSLPSVALATESSSISLGDSTVVFGGWDGTEQRNDIAVFNASTGTWYTPPYTGSIPRTRNSHGGILAYTKSAYFGANASDLPSGKLWLDEAQPVFINAYGWGGTRLVIDTDIFSFSNHSSDASFDQSFPSDMEIHLSEENGTEFEVVTAHRILLFCRSSRFKRIFSGEDSDSSKYELIKSTSETAAGETRPTVFKVRAESTDAFKGMIHFFYTDEIVREAGWLVRNSRALARLVDIWAPELSPKLLERLLLPRSTMPNLFGSQLLAGFSNEKFSDLVLAVNDPETGEHADIPVHKLVLTSRSPYFRALCLGGMAESAQKVISVEAPIGAFKLILEFLYSYEVPYDRIAEHIIDLFVLASRFQVAKLQSTLENLLIFNLAPENVGAILHVAQEQSAQELATQCLKYIQDHPAEMKEFEETL